MPLGNVVAVLFDALFFTVGIITRDHVPGHLLFPPGEETLEEVLSISFIARH